MVKLAENKDLQRLLGENGKNRVLAEFDGSKVTENWLKFYHEILS